MKVSVVVTVLNEEKTINFLLESLIKQTQKPDEIIIVDGGSTDSTVANIKYQISNIKYVKDWVRVFVKTGASIAQGRNFGIKKAKNDVIAMTDAGCVAKRNWLEKITAPFKDKRVELVAGFYKMTGRSLFQRALAPFLGIHPQRFVPQEYLPSTRSIAFRKSLWRRIGGFLEELEQTAEDTRFNYQALKLGAKIARVKEALVYWEISKTLPEAAKKFYLYAKGDAQAGIWWHPTQRLKTHNLKILAIYGRYLLGLMLLILSAKLPFLLVLLGLLFTLYLFWPVWKVREVVQDSKAKLWLPIIQILSDLVVMAGFLSGLFPIRLRRVLLFLAFQLK